MSNWRKELEELVGYHFDSLKERLGKLEEQYEEYPKVTLKLCPNCKHETLMRVGQQRYELPATYSSTTCRSAGNLWDYKCLTCGRCFMKREETRLVEYEEIKEVNAKLG